MATAREDKHCEGEFLGTGGKFRKRPHRRTHTTPYDRPPISLRNPIGSIGWIAKIVDPAQKLISSGAQKIFSSVFRKRLTPPPTPSTSQQPPPPKSASQVLNHEESRKHMEPVGTDVRGKQERVFGQIKCQTVPDESYFAEIEQLLKQKTFTRSEIDSLTALLRSRTMETSIGDEAKRHVDNIIKPDFSNDHKDILLEKTSLENGVGNHQVSCQITGSMSQGLDDDDFGSPAALAKSYMASKPSKASQTLLGLQNQSHLNDSSFLNYQSTPASSPSTSVFPWHSSHIGNVENGLTTAKYKGRFAVYKMAQIPYSRVQPSSALKGVELKHDVYTEPSSSSRLAWDHNSLSTTRQGAQKRRSSVLENDIGSVGPIRRIRHKPNLLSSRGLRLQVSGSTLSLTGTIAGTDGTQSPMKQPVLHDKAKNIYHTKSCTEKIDDPNTTLNSCPPSSSKSSEMASKILQQLDKIVPSKDKLSVFKVPDLADDSPQKLSRSMLHGQALRSLEHVESSRFLDAHEDISRVDRSVNNSSPASMNTHTSKHDNVDNGPSKLIVSFGAPASSKKNTLSGSILVESSVVEFAVPPPQNKRAFHMSAHEDFLDVDDGSCSNGTASSLSTKGKDIVDVKPAADQKAIDSRLRAQENSSSVDEKSKYCCPEGSFLAKSSKISDSKSVFSSSLTQEARLQSTLVSDKAVSWNQSDSSLHTSPLFSRDNGVESSIEQKASIPIFGGDKFVSTEEPAAAVSNVVSNKSVDSLQVPYTISSIGESIPIFKGDEFVSSQKPATLSSNVFSVDSSRVISNAPSIGVERTTFAGANSDSEPVNVSSPSTAALSCPTDSSPKVPEIDKADGKNNSFPGVYGRSSEAAGGTASTPLPSSGLFSFSSILNKSNPTNGTLPTSAPLSASFPPVPIVNVVGTTSSSTSNFTSAAIPVFNHSASVSSNSVSASSSSLSTSVSEPPFATPTFPKFGASAFSTAYDKPVSATSDKSMFAASSNSTATSTLSTVFGGLSGTMFGGSSVSCGSANGSEVFGFNTASMPSACNQSQSSTFGGQASAATCFPTFTQSMPSSASSASTGLANNSGSSLFSASTSTSIFSSASSFTFNATPASSASNSVSYSSAPSTGIYSSSSWQPGKSTTSFTSSVPSMFSFGSSATSAAAPTSTPSTSLPSPVFSSEAGTTSAAPSTTSSSSFFPFTSPPETTSSQPVFNSPGAAFRFGSPAPPNNSEMSMEDRMAEDGFQGCITPFPHQSVAPISNVAFSSSTNPPGVPNPFQFGVQQNFSTSQNPSPFQPATSVDFSGGGGSFSLGSGGGDKSNRRIVKVNRNRQRKK